MNPRRSTWPVSRASLVNRRRSRRAGLDYQPLESRNLLAGDFVWADQLGGAGNELGQAIAADLAGNSYVLGNFSGTVDFDPGPGTWAITAAGAQDAFLAKLNPAGGLIWVRTFGGTGWVASNAMEIDPSGALLIVGSFTGTSDFDPGAGVNNFVATSGSWDGFVAKLNFDGNLEWARHLGGTGAGVTLGESAAVLISGAFSGTRDFDPGVGTTTLSSLNEDGYVVKLDWQGNFVWARDFNAGNGSSRALVRDLVVDEGGHVYTTGEFQGQVDFDPGTLDFNLVTPDLFSDGFVTKLDGDGNFVWAKGAAGTFMQRGVKIQLDEWGQPIIAGSFSGTADFDPDGGVLTLVAGQDDGFVWKLATNGSLLWVRQIGGSQIEDVFDMTSDGQGSLYLTGQFSGTADFNPGLAVSNLVSFGASDAFVLKLNAHGGFVWARQLGGSDLDEGRGIAVDPGLNLLTTGVFRGTADFDPRAGIHTLTGVGSSDAFAVKLTQNMVFRAHPSARQLTLRKNSLQLQILDDSTGSVLLARPLSQYLGVQVGGVSLLSDRLTVDFAAGGILALPGGIQFNGGSSGADILRLWGTGVEDVIVTSGLNTGRTHFNVMEGVTFLTTISASNVEGAKLSQVRRLDFLTRGSNDTLTAAPVVSDWLTPATRLSGTSGSVAIVPLTFSETPLVTLDLAFYDLEASSNDRLTFASGGFKAQGLRDLTIITGYGDDHLSVNDADLQLPVPGGDIRFQPGEGIDQLNVSADTNLFINSSRLKSGLAGRILFDSLESAVLTGGASDNELSATGFNGSVALYGHDGNDILRGTGNTDSLYGGNGNDRLIGGRGNDYLFGEAGFDTFYFDGTNDPEDLQLLRDSDTIGYFNRFLPGTGQLLEQDFFRFDSDDQVEIRAWAGNDQIFVDLTFAILGIVNGGEGSDFCTAPDSWTKISC